MSSNFTFLTTEIIKGTKLNRVRINEDKKFNNVGEISYPKPYLVSQFNRVNRPGQSIFYCSESTQSCEMELLSDFLTDKRIQQPKEIGYSKCATYSEWVLQKDLKLLVLAFAKPNQEFSTGAQLNACYNKHLKSVSEKEKLNLIQQYEWTSKYFHKESKDNRNAYFITSAIANFASIYNSANNIDGFIYPCTQMQCGYNFGLYPKIIDNEIVKPNSTVSMSKWKIKEKKMVELYEKDFSIGKITCNFIEWTPVGDKLKHCNVRQGLVPS
jgi:hypothetical protein